MGDAALRPTQKAISAPKILRNLQLLADGSEAPAIQISGDMIIEGHHRYVAGKIHGWEPKTVPGNATSATNVTTWKNVITDPADWDNPDAL